MSGLFLGDLELGEVDLDAYCRRVGYAGPREPTLATLRELQRLHAAAIPFEAIDVRRGLPVRLESAAVDAKLISERRGGYCFEQNTLLLRVLRKLGFATEALMARSRWRRPLHEHVARTHMALRVRVDAREWLVDVGFGACMLTSPLAMDCRTPQETRHEPARLTPLDGELRVERLLGERWEPLFDLVLAPQQPVDLVAANWLISTHPASSFRHHLVVSRTTDELRLVLVDARLTTRRTGAPVEHRELDAEELAECLERDFGLSVEPAWRALFLEIALPRVPAGP